MYGSTLGAWHIPLTWDMLGVCWCILIGNTTYSSKFFCLGIVFQICRLVSVSIISCLLMLAIIIGLAHTSPYRSLAAALNSILMLTICDEQRHVTFCCRQHVCCQNDIHVSLNTALCIGKTGMIVALLIGMTRMIFALLIGMTWPEKSLRCW